MIVKYYNTSSYEVIQNETCLFKKPIFCQVYFFKRATVRRIQFRAESHGTLEWKKKPTKTKYKNISFSNVKNSLKK